MLYVDAKKQIIDDIGVVNWQPRIARCLVILPARQQHTAVLEGMLSVLQLPARYIIRAVVKDCNPQLVSAKIQQWRPQTILQLSMEHPEIAANNVIRTYSPDYLAKNPREKGIAYKQLLLLKEKIHHDSA